GVSGWMAWRRRWVGPLPRRAPLGGLSPRERLESATGPVADAAGVAVDELRVRVEADAAHAQRADVVQHLTGADAADAEVDRVAVRVLAVARDLVALLAQHQVVLRRAVAGDD